MRPLLRIVAVATLGAVAFVAGARVGDGRAEVSLEAARADAMASAIEQTRWDTRAAVDEAVVQLARETAAEAPILDRIVREPFARRGLLP